MVRTNPPTMSKITNMERVKEFSCLQTVKFSPALHLSASFCMLSNKKKRENTAINIVISPTQLFEIPFIISFPVRVSINFFANLTLNYYCFVLQSDCGCGWS